MTYTDFSLKVRWYQRQIMDQPLDSLQRQEWIRIKREIEAAAIHFFTNEKATVAPVAVEDFDADLSW
jgi:aminoglycoside/choline kinase family phosphotransferase